MSKLKTGLSIALAVVVGAAAATGFLVLYSGDAEASEPAVDVDGVSVVADAGDMVADHTNADGTVSIPIVLEPQVISGEAISADGTDTTPGGSDDVTSEGDGYDTGGSQAVAQGDDASCGLICRGKQYVADVWKGLRSN